MNCGYCKRKFRKLKSNFRHINILQEITSHLFCSKRCKKAWQKDIVDSNPKKIIVWNVSITSSTYFFSKGMEYDYISPFASGFSYFSKELGDS